MANSKQINIDKNTNKWTISFNSFSGLAPQWYSNSYLFYGNKQQASYMKNVDITDSNVLTQGSGVATLDSTITPTLTALIKGITKSPSASDVAFATGGNLVHKFSSTAIVDDASFPHTIDKATVTDELGEDICYYNGVLYYFYNHSGSHGDIGSYDMTTTFDDVWGSTYAVTGEMLSDGTHQAIVGGDDIMYFTNVNYVGYYDDFDSVFEAQGLDFTTDSEVSSIAWNGDKLIIAVNRPMITGSNYSSSFICSWNGTSSSYDSFPIMVSGKIGALLVKNGVTFVWWNDGGTNIFGYVSGLKVVPLKRFSGSLPLFYQVCEYKGFISWLVDGEVMLWGAGDVEVPTTMSKYMSSTGTVSGGIAAPFNSFVLASSNTAGDAWYFELETNYTVSAEFKTIAFDVSSPTTTSYIDLIVVETEQLETGAKCDFTLQYNFGKSSSALTQIAYSTDNNTRHRLLNRSLGVENFRLDLDWKNGSATKPVKIRAIWISGRSITNN